MTAESPAEPCAFCTIASSVPTFDPTTSESLGSSAYPAGFDLHNVILSTQSYLALLDIQPLVSAACHILLIPRMHYERISDFPTSSTTTAAAAADVNHDLGELLALLGRALRHSFRDVTDFNIVQNNGPAAGQIVSHVHFHIIARPTPDSITTTADSRQSSSKLASPRLQYASLIYGKGARSDLDPDFARKTCDVLRRYVYRNYWYNKRQRMQPNSKL
ncbi:HIT-like domain-containing protein [Lipomyces kononenkoae]|uniref:HIT-like domain-containing protein n=1 Tax=Lipomyces kononenkoae TaxID=34357 RepID=A0ACC3T4J7_LIPKO